jgi:hypothetical protein
MTTGVPRRRFLALAAGGVGATVLAARWADIVAALSHARGSGAPPPLEVLTAEQAAELEAMAAQIFPADDLPGARELRAVYFIDRALATFGQETRQQYVDGLALLRGKIAELYPQHATFAALTHEEQLHVLRAIEDGPFFDLVRFHTILGCLTLPERGGNHGSAGWAVLGRDHRPTYQPPYGEYDRGYQEA